MLLLARMVRLVLWLLYRLWRPVPRGFLFLLHLWLQWSREFLPILPGRWHQLILHHLLHQQDQWHPWSLHYPGFLVVQMVQWRLWYLDRRDFLFLWHLLHQLDPMDPMDPMVRWHP